MNLFSVSRAGGCALPVWVSAILFLVSCTSENPLFERIPVSVSGVDFVNLIPESDSLNVLDYEYLYNGAGVAAADFDNDGLTDLFFAGNRTENRFYLNQAGVPGEISFTDATEESGLAGNTGKWYSGVSVVDMNHDGLPDIYLCATGGSDPEMRKNELYINLGTNENGVPVFEEKAEAYGLDDTSYSTQAFFFDYDNDGDLDMYLLVAYSSSSYRNINAQKIASPGSSFDKLFRNTGSGKKGHSTYTDVSEQAGITKEGYGLGAGIIDINGDGYKDIYVANDYVTEDLFWINNGDGTFTDRAGDLFKHSSYSAMGTDIADLNNDGLPDIFTLDMLPELNVRRKMMANPNNYRNEVNDAFRGYQKQYTRNTLQLNAGPADSSGLPVFSEVALLAGVAATDWSWAPLLADLDNDGYRDIFITNGIPRDITDKDFWDEYGRVREIMSKRMALPKIPEVHISNYAFRNNPSEAKDGAVMFDNVTSEWGFSEPTFSSGAIYADLDNDGALDLVISNINEPAFIYRNTLYDERNGDTPNWLKVKISGEPSGSILPGAVVDVYFGGEHHQRHEHTFYRGYLSSVEPLIHFGLGAASTADSVVVTWALNPADLGGSSDASVFYSHVMRQVKANQTVTASLEQAGENIPYSRQKPEPVFYDTSGKRGLIYRHQTVEFDDFREQPLIPYKRSELAFGQAAADIDGDGLEDFFIAGGYGENPACFLQGKDGTFSRKRFVPEGGPDLRNHEISSVLFFDADGNGTQDLYLVSGGVRHVAHHENYRDLFYRNNGDGTFTYLPAAIPDIAFSGSVVISSDYNGDGRPDLFVGGWGIPGRYPEPESSRLYRNDSHEGRILFTDVTEEIAPELINFGLVNDAVWTDFNGDGASDLVIAGEWMPLRFFENSSAGPENRLTDVTAKAGDPEKTGWWSRVVAADLNGDGREDLIAGNLGLNSLYRASSKEPVSVYFGDLNEDGFFESFPAVYGRDTEWEKREFPINNREDAVRQMPHLSDQFPTHREYGLTPLNRLLTTPEMNLARKEEARYFSSAVYMNRGNGTFETIPLPAGVQAAPVYGILPGDFDGDGTCDLLISGNLSGADLQTGSYDAFNGIFLYGNGDGTFRWKHPSESGFYLPGNGRLLTEIEISGEEILIAAGQYNGFLKTFERSVNGNLPGE